MNNYIVAKDHRGYAVWISCLYYKEYNSISPYFRDMEQAEQWVYDRILKLNIDLYYIDYEVI